MQDDDEGGGSAPCFAHMLVDGQPVDQQTVLDVARFRRAERLRLLDARKRLPTQQRAQLTDRLIRALDDLIVLMPGQRIAVYWPIRGEPDLRSWMARRHAAGATVLLPVVVEKAAPLVFRRWSPNCVLERGIWDIPVPVAGDAVQPDVIVIPLLGADSACFRLGNGGGYYDRTVAGLDPRPRLIGVGFPCCRLPTIYPMPWDIPMDSILCPDAFASPARLD